MDMKKDMGEWTAKMKSLYEKKLTITHTLLLNDDEYPVNAAVLYAALPNIPSDQWQLCFSQINNGLIGDILQYLYSCEITVSLATLKDVLLASKVLKLGHLQDTCEQFLLEHLCPENYIGWYKFCTQENFEGIAKYCRDKIIRELDKVRQCKEFQGLTFAEVNDLIKEHVENADTQFYAMMTWVLGNKERHGQVEELTHLIDLSQCSKKCLQRATETPYKEVLWSVSLQHKLMKACLNIENRSAQEEEAVYIPCEDDTKGITEFVLGLEIQSNMDFAKSMMPTYQSFKTYSVNTDVTIQISDGEIKAHQIVLATASLYFEALIRSSSAEVENPESCESLMKIDLTQLNAAAVTALVDFMYTGIISIDDHALLDLIQACDFLRLETLLGKCKEHTEDRIKMTPENCYQWIVGSNLFNLPKTRDRAVKFVCGNFQNVHHVEGLVKLGHTDMLDVLNDDTLGSVPEETLYNTLMYWIMYEQEDRRKYLPTFLQSKAMKSCLVDQELDMKKALDAGNFDSAEREQIWAARFERLAVVSFIFLLTPIQWRTQDFANVYTYFVLCVCVCLCVCVVGGGPSPPPKKRPGKCTHCVLFVLLVQYHN